MEPELITYRIFNDIALADDLAELLKDNNITYQLHELTDNFDPGFRLKDESQKEFAVKINSADFFKVNLLLQAKVAEQLKDVDKDHYLFSFTDDELKDVLLRFDEWNAFDVVLARMILANRGKDISDNELSDLKLKRLKDLRKPEAPQSIWIVIGYILAFMGGILGLFIGWHLFTHRKTLPNGEMVFDYTDNDRRHGKRILYISIAVLIICFILKVWVMVNS